MTRTKLFKTNRTQAVRLPKGVAFPEDVEEVTVRRVGAARVISPVGATWDDFFDQPSVDILQYPQPTLQTRDDW